jgi:phosphoribosylanthranilate isomerase
MKVKVCGIKSFEDATLAVEAGADALGFILYPGSRRYCCAEAVRSIVRRLPPFIVTVGVFVNVPAAEELDQTAREAGIGILQLHGDEPPEFCRALGSWPLIKTFFPATGSAGLYEKYDVRAYLLDSRAGQSYGGTGKTFDWGLAGEVPRSRPVILAGGLHSGNVSEAIKTIRPYAVDVCSGVESAPGKKDPGKLRDFFNEVRNAE